MNRYERIIALLKEELQPIQLELYDDSHKHAGHSGSQPGGETHYRLIVESDKLKAKSRVQAHQHVFKILDQEFKTGLHALSIQVIR